VVLAALLAGLLVAAMGCLAEPDDGSGSPNGGGGKDGGDDPVGDPDPPVVAPKAWFILQSWQLRSPDWPDRWADVDLFVCDAAMPAADLATIRAARPEARLLAYTNLQDVPLGRYSGNPYYQALEAAFDSSWCIRNLDTGDVVRLYAVDPEVPDSGWPAWVVHENSADALVAFHRDVTMATGWDGMYVDQCTAAWPTWKMDDLLAVTTNFDVNDDGIADTPATLRSEYATWRPYFTAELRAALGDDAVVVGNAGGALADAALNGVTLEGVGTRFSVEEAGTILDGAEAVARSPFAAVLWATTPATEAPSEELAATRDGVYYGVVALE
jgi:hypothetical protein